jgi:hypothetical protein
MFNDVLQKVKAPAIALLVIGILNALIAILILAGGAVRLAGLTGPEPIPTDEAQRMGYYAGTIGGYAVAFLSLIVAPVIIWGAIQMMKGKKLGLAKTAAILAIIPLTSCCFIIGIPFGIWALVVLGKPDVKALFRGELSQQHFPPQPPQNW